MAYYETSVTHCMGMRHAKIGAEHLHFFGLPHKARKKAG